MTVTKLIYKLCYKLKDRKGNSSILGALIVLPVLISLSMNPILMFLDAQKYSTLEEIAKNYVIRMETEGGLTVEAYTNLLSDLAQAGFNISKTTITYTPYPADIGSEIKLQITTEMKMARISLLGGSLKTNVYKVTVGPYTSVSKKAVSYH